MAVTAPTAASDAPPAGMDTDPVIERCLARVSAQRKWVQFLRYTGTLGAVLALLALVGGFAILHGWLADRHTFEMAATTLAGLAVVAWLFLALAAAASDIGRDRLAQQVERVQPALLDRLNTLVHLEQRRGDAQVQPFYERIEGQARATLTAYPVPSPFPVTAGLAHVVAMAVLLLLASLFYRHYRPLDVLRVAAKPGSAQLPTLEPPPEPEKTAWGEVRITRPGRDVTAGRADVIPLRIEAAAGEALRGVEWVTSLNGGPEQRQALPAPTEPRYAVHEPQVDLKAFGAQDWDVLAYYAAASTESGRSLVSDIYFIHVVPPKEELAKLPGGQDGDARALLKDLTDLVQQHAEVIRGAHRERNSPPGDLEAHRQERERLAQAEEELSLATKHLDARVPDQEQRQPLGAPLSRVANARNSLDSAAREFRNENLPAADPPARTALSELAAARKQLQDSVRRNPGPFSRPKAQTAGEQSQALRRMAEERRQARACSNAVRAMAAEQQQIANQAQERVPRADLADREEGLRRKLEKLRQQNPGACSRASAECNSASGALSNAAQTLRRGQGGAKYQTGAAAGELRKLAQALDGGAGEQELSNAYKLRRMLRQQRKTMAAMERNPDSVSEEERRQCANNLKETARQLKEVAEKSAARQCFKPNLRKALNEKSQQRLSTSCNKICSNPSAGACKQAASGARAGAAAIGEAFDASRPGARGQPTPQPADLAQAQSQQAPSQAARQAAEQAARQTASPGGKQGSQQAARQPSSPSGKQGAQQAVRPATPPGNKPGPQRPAGQQEKGRQTREGARDGIARPGRPDARAEPTPATPRGARSKERPRQEMDPALLQRLQRELDAVRVERVGSAKPKGARPDLRHLDPSRFAPAYRDRLERYYEKLAGQR